MQTQLRFALRAGVLLIGLALCHCSSSKSRSQNVNVTVNPSRPIVFTANLTYDKNGTPVTITGPWFKFSLALNNTDTSSSITVIGVHVEVTGMDGSGNSTTTKTDLDPSTDDFTTVSNTCNYTDYGQFDPGGNATNSAGAGYNNTGLFEVPASDSIGTCPTVSPVFYVGSLPTYQGQTNFSYTVMIQPEGWFGTRNNPTDRYQEYIYTSTQ